VGIFCTACAGETSLVPKNPSFRIRCLMRWTRRVFCSQDQQFLKCESEFSRNFWPISLSNNFNALNSWPSADFRSLGLQLFPGPPDLQLTPDPLIFSGWPSHLKHCIKNSKSDRVKKFVKIHNSQFRNWSLNLVSKIWNSLWRCNSNRRGVRRPPPSQNNQPH